MLEYDVLIAGFGPTGAVAANLLGQFGVRVLVVEPELEIFDIPRAVHFDGEVMRIFQSLGLAKEVEKVSAPGVSLGFTNGRNWTLFEQDLTKVPKAHDWENSNFFNQPALERNLRAGVERFACVDVCLGESVTGFTQSDNEVVVQLSSESDHREVRVAFLLGCDGAGSTVRKTLDVVQADLQCDEPWLVCDWIIPADVPINRRAFQICDPKRPTTRVPCEGAHIRWEFMVNPEDTIEGLEDETQVRAMMAPHVHRLSAHLSADMGELVRAKVYNFHALLAETFQQGRIFLLGDAAHQTPPFLGQGMCAGMRDAHNLSWKLAGTLQGRYAFSMLTSYTTERRPHVHEVIKTAVGHGGVIQNRSHILAFVRDCYLKLGRLLPVFVKFLRFDLGWPLGDGLLDLDSAQHKNSPVASPFPQYAGSDRFLGEGFVWVSLEPATSGQVHIDASQVLQLSIDELSEGSVAVKKAFTEWFADHQATAVLVRPDRYVYGYCRVGQLSAEQLKFLVDQLYQQLQKGLV